VCACKLTLSRVRPADASAWRQDARLANVSFHRALRGHNRHNRTNSNGSSSSSSSGWHAGTCSCAARSLCGGRRGVSGGRARQRRRGYAGAPHGQHTACVQLTGQCVCACAAPFRTRTHAVSLTVGHANSSR
jgi:hypothetical protein